MKVSYFFYGLALIVIITLLFTSKNRFQWIKAAILFILQLSFSTLNFLLFFSIAYLIMKNGKQISLGNLFLFMGILVVISGIFIFYGMLVFHKKIIFSSTILSLIEYYIQWSLIYVTVYQAIFSNLKHIAMIARVIRVGNLLNPNLIIVTILPSFISAWIATILYKKHFKFI